MTATTSSTEQLVTARATLASTHLQLHFRAVLARVLQTLTSLPEADGNQARAHLVGHDQALADDEPAGLTAQQRIVYWDAQAAAYGAPDGTALPLTALEQRWGPTATRLLVYIGMTEDDATLGLLNAMLQQPPGGSRPSAAMSCWILGEGSAGRRAITDLVDDGWLEVEDRRVTRAEWRLRVPRVVWDVASEGAPRSGSGPMDVYSRLSFPGPEDLILAAGAGDVLDRVTAALAQGNMTVVLRGGAGRGRRTLAGCAAAQNGHDLLVYDGADPGTEDWARLGPVAMMTGAVPLLRVSPEAGATLRLPALRGYDGPVAVTLGAHGGLAGSLLDRAVAVQVPLPDREARRRLWQEHLPELGEGAQEVVDRHLVGPGTIARAARSAMAYAASEGRAVPTASDVRRSARDQGRRGLETLATRLDAVPAGAGLVVSGSTGEDLAALLSHCLHREALRDAAGPALSATLTRGVRALLSGPSGTGKTLAARVLARDLGHDLYRLDLSSVVNKYIGETEHNLELVLSGAEELDVVLLLDEGDALLTRRTDVSSSTDRYANLETDFLLQRLETFEGIALITTNAAARIDEAFLRRLDAVVEFRPPGAAERYEIWRAHLPVGHRIDDGLISDIAVRCELSGGQIRNATLHALLLSLAGSTTVSAEDLLAALRREYRRAGDTCPL